MVKLLLILVAITAIVLAAYFFMQNRQLKNKTIAESDAAEVKALTAKLSELMILPKGTPTIASIVDKSKLSKDPFFAAAENGDKVLVFTEGQKAVLYRPSTGKIVDITTISMSQTPTNTESGAGTANLSQPKVQVYNGTLTAGLAIAARDKIKTKFPNVAVSTNGNAKAIYKKTIVVLNSKAYAKVAKELADFVGGTVSESASGEDLAGADISIIIGK